MATQTRYRRWVARWLLMVFVPMFVLSSLHLHDEGSTVDSSCYACAHHLHHPDHVGQLSLHMQQCFLCQFMATPALPAVELALIVPVLLFFVLSSIVVANMTLGCVPHQHLRGPPSLL